MAVLARYPSNLDNDEFYRSKIKFEAFETIPFQLSSISKADWQRIGSNIDRASTGGLDADQLAKDVTNNTNKRERFRSTGQAIELYLPVSLQMNDGFQYENAQLGAAGAVAEAALGSGMSAVGAAAMALTEGAKGISDIGKLFSGGEIGQLASARLAQFAPGGVQAGVELATQTVMNPNIRAAFKSVSLRTFQFLFNMIPNNESDSQAIKDIIYFFRMNAYPEDIPAGSSVPLAYQYPNLFKITPMVLDVKSGVYRNVGSEIKYCYCQSIGTNFNPIGNTTFHDDGSPVQTDLSLSFTEHKTLSRSDIKPTGSKLKGDYEGGVSVELFTNDDPRFKNGMF